MIVNENFTKYISSPKYFANSKNLDTHICKFSHGDLSSKQVFFEPLKSDDKRESDTVWTVNECLKRGNEIGIFCEVEKFMKHADRITIVQPKNFDGDWVDLKNPTEFKNEIKSQFTRIEKIEDEKWVAHTYKRK